MASLMELVERIGKGDLVEAEPLELYEDSANSAEKFLAHHAHALLDLRKAQQHLMQSLEAIDYSDQKVLNEFVSISGFLGLADLRTGPVIKFAASAIARREYALGLEAIQNGLVYDQTHGGSFSADKSNCQNIALQYERVAQSIGCATPAADWGNKQVRIAVIVSAIADEEPAARALRGLAKHCDAKKTKLCVYSTEAFVRRDKQQFAPGAQQSPSAKRGEKTIDVLAKEKVVTWIASTDGDCVSAAKDLAAQLIKDKIDVAIFDAGQCDPIAAIVANWPIARAKVNLVRSSPLYATGVQNVTYFDQSRFEADKSFWQKKGIASRYILEGVDLGEDLGTMPQRATYGIPEQAVVLVTAGADLDKTISAELVEMMIGVLRAHPHVIYLLVGEAELAWQKRKFESAGVGKRVGYAGKRKDMPSFLRLADVYVAEFPACGSAGVLAAMSMERPVVAVRWGDSIEQSQAASLAGPEAALAGKETGPVIERISKLIRDAAARQQLGKTMKQRVEQHFSFAQTAHHIEQLCEQLTQKPETAPAPAPTPLARLEEPLIKVA